MALLSEYGFNEGTGSTTADSSGNGYNLTTDGSGWVVGGHTNGGGKESFTGIVGPNVSQSTWTVMAWVKRSGLTPIYGAILSNNSNFYFELSHGGDQAECYAGNGTFPQSAQGAIADTTWVHLAATRKSDSTCTLYINGTSVSVGLGNAMNFGSGTWYLAGAAGSSAYTLNGVVDDLRVFDQELSPAEITTWMNTPVGSSTPSGRKFRLGTTPKPIKLGSVEVFVGP